MPQLFQKMIDFDNYFDCGECKNKCIVQFLSKEDFPILTENKSVIFYSPGQVITKQASFASKIVFITSGLVKILKEGKNGKNSLVKVVGANNFITVPIHENHKKNSFTTIALTEVEICEINETGIHNLIAKNQKVFDLLMDFYHEDQVYLMNRIHLLSTHNNHGKLAASLVLLNAFNKPGFSVFDYISRKDLAELSSISIESVNKILQELKNDLILDINNKGIQILKFDLIEKLSNSG